jgi:hypothetical protein
MDTSTESLEPSHSEDPIVISKDFLLGSARESLERIRLRLLDLSNRNKLLNFRYTKKSSLQIVAASSDHVFEKLVDGEALTFASVPEPPENGDEQPTAAEHAKTLGIPTSIELSESRANSRSRKSGTGVLQTLHYSEELEAILRRINYAAKTAIEESGTNMLYLVFGFLEWYESDNSTEARLAPILAVPVTITRGKQNPRSGTFPYEITYLSDGIEANLSLREKLKRDFGLEFPDPSEDDTPETYFLKFEGLLTNKPRWKLRRRITLALLYFGKLRMYRDLDPRSWPREGGLLEHRLIKDLFEGPKTTDLTFADEYPIDSPALSKQVPPLILNADSSQHSAIIDALKGRDLVIEGPPGTGKSQTIANLIAATLEQGKTVLFVSDKLAALEVVRRRLDDTGLGIFCLELHSHKTEKRKLLDDIEARLNARRSFRDAPEIDAKISLLERSKLQLLRYVELINSSYGETRRSIFDIIWAREKFKQELGSQSNAVERCRISNVQLKSNLDYQLDCELLEDYRTHLSETIDQHENLTRHPWYGIKNSLLEYSDQQQALDFLRTAAEAAELLDQEVQEFNSLGAISLRPTAQAVKQLIEIRSELPEQLDPAPAELMQAFVDQNNRSSALSFSGELAGWWNERSRFKSYFAEIPLITDADFRLVEQLYETTVEFQIGSKTTRELRDLIKQASVLKNKLNNAIALMKRGFRYLECDVTIDQNALSDFVAVLRLLEAIPKPLLAKRSASLQEEGVAVKVDAAEREAQDLINEKVQLTNLIELDVLDLVSLNKHICVLENSSLFKRLLGREYKQARQELLRYWKGPSRPNRELMIRSFKGLHQFTGKL